MALADAVVLHRALAIGAAALAVAALVLLFGTLSVRWMISDTGWYRASFEKNDISLVTGIPKGELSESAGQISQYLLLKRNQLDDLSVTVRGQPRPLFNERETLHLSHVRGLLRDLYILQFAAGGYLVLYLIVARQSMLGGARRDLGRKLRWAGILTFGVFGAFGLLSLLSFDELFLQFHLASFEGDCWLFDPTTDNLVMMFPQAFWNDSAVRLAMATGAQALAAIAVGSLFERRGPRRSLAKFG
jgi:integral membrane protein (TIGR01906 family)